MRSRPHLRPVAVVSYDGVAHGLISPLSLTRLVTRKLASC